MGRAAVRFAGLPLVAISDGLAAAWLQSKTKDIAASQTLYAVATDFDTVKLIGDGSRRILIAIKQLLASAAVAKFENPGSISFVLRAVLGDTVRSVLERGATAAGLITLRAELPLLCGAYLLASATETANAPTAA